MWRMLVPVLLLAGCAQLPSSPEDIQAKRFEVAPDKSVIYIARMRVDSNGAGSLMLDDRASITTSHGTYYRWEVAPGAHRITGMGFGTEAVTLNTAPGKLYFVQHTVLEDKSDGAVIFKALREVDEQTGRRLVAQAELIK